MGLFSRKKAGDPDRAFALRLAALIAEARKAGASNGSMISAMSGHIVSWERQALQAAERHGIMGPVRSTRLRNI